MAQAGAEDKLDWSQIDTVLLDMDGTLLDLNFDLHFLDGIHATNVCQ